jgi:hypothetical protein
LRTSNPGLFGEEEVIALSREYCFFVLGTLVQIFVIDIEVSSLPAPLYHNFKQYRAASNLPLYLLNSATQRVEVDFVVNFVR